MAIAIYPNDDNGLEGLGYNVHWTPVFFNASQKTLTGASIDIALASSPLHGFELTYPFLRNYATSTIEFKLMMGFFLFMGGSAGRFLFLNPDDNGVASQAIGTGDGVTDVFPMVRTFGTTPLFFGDVGAGGAKYTETVGYVQQQASLEDWDPVLFPGIAATERIFYNGGLRTAGTDYVIDNSSPGNPRLSCMTVPTSGPITADFGYYYYCKFVDDTLDFQKWVSTVWQLDSVKLMSCRAGA